MTALSFTVPGAPVPKARPRVFRGRTITEPRTVAYEGLVRSHALRARQQAKRAGVAWPMDAEYRVRVEFFLPDRRRRDLDNLLKGVLDACNTVLWDDDSQVSRLAASRALADADVVTCAVVIVEVLP